MKPLYEDQIHAPAFQKLSDFIWTANPHDDYVNSVIKDYNFTLKSFGSWAPLQHRSGVIFVGHCQLIEDCFVALPTEGNYIVIHRTNDRSFTEPMYEVKPKSVKHVYTVDCQVNHPDVSAIPIGFSTIAGEDEIIKVIVKEEIPKASTRVFCRYNVNESGYTQARIDSLGKLQLKPFARVVLEQMPVDEFYRSIKAHEFTMSLKGGGADACRTWDAITLGSIPIVSDCIEMRHFEDMPIAFSPSDVNEITEEWLNAQIMTGKSTDRMRMSYWEDHLNKKKAECGI